MNFEAQNINTHIHSYNIYFKIIQCSQASKVIKHTNSRSNILLQFSIPNVHDNHLY